MDEDIFGWLHLSDIHFGHGNRDYSANQRAVLKALRQHLQTDVRPQVDLDAIFVTGDIAFSGKAEQYTAARELLLDFSKLLDIPPNRIFLVPGNHDVDRAIDDTDQDIGLLLTALRSGQRKLSDRVAHEANKERLRSRMAAYFDFAKAFAPVEPLPGQPFSWKKELVVGDVGDVLVRLFGLNTALLCADDADRGKLQVGMTWAEELVGTLRSNTQHINIILTHHPFLDGWLQDGADADGWAMKYAQIHLMGHVHEADSRATIPGYGTSLIRVVSGAGHADPKDPPQHSYSYAKIVRASDKNLRLHLFPYKWSNTQRAFVLDADRCNNSGYASYPLMPKTYHSIPPPRHRTNTSRRVLTYTMGNNEGTSPEAQMTPTPTAISTPVPDERLSTEQTPQPPAPLQTPQVPDMAASTPITPTPGSTATSAPTSSKPAPPQDDPRTIPAGKATTTSRPSRPGDLGDLRRKVPQKSTALPSTEGRRTDPPEGRTSGSVAAKDATPDAHERSPRSLRLIMIGVAMTAVAAVLLVVVVKNQPTPRLEPAPSKTVPAPPPPTETLTSTVSQPDPTYGASVTQPPQPKVSSCPPGMKHIPGGQISQKRPGPTPWSPDMRGVHVDAFCIDEAEVTVGEYVDCKDRRNCAEPVAQSLVQNWESGLTSACNWDRRGDSTMLSHPINCVNWSQAKEFCRSMRAGGRLPSMAEWEIATQPREAAGWQMYPWSAPDIGNRPCWSGHGTERVAKLLTTCQVRTQLEDRSEWDIFDLGGNVMEWTETTSRLNDGRYIVKGGSWRSNKIDMLPKVPVHESMPENPDRAHDYVGFRCAASPR